MEGRFFGPQFRGFQSKLSGYEASIDKFGKFDIGFISKTAIYPKDFNVTKTL